MEEHIAATQQRNPAQDGASISAQKVKPRILIIDDNPDDRALAIRELRREMPEAVTQEVSDQRGLEGALHTGDFDLVITDYQLRWNDGLHILKALRSRWPDLPVIMFTGTGSEEIAVEAMKLGLDDYVLKSPRHYTRLVSSVKASLQLGEHRRRRREAETRYQTLFDTVPVGLFRCTPAGVILDANEALVSMLGFRDRQDLSHWKMPDLHAHPRDYARWREVLERHGAVASFESHLRDAHGRLRCVEIHAKALRDAETGQIIYEGSAEEITERKKAESERENLIDALQEALAKVKTLSGLLPICSSCKKIRDEEGEWTQLEAYIRERSHAEFTHSVCPDCLQRLYPELAAEVQHA